MLSHDIGARVIKTTVIGLSDDLNRFLSFNGAPKRINCCLDDGLPENFSLRCFRRVHVVRNRRKIKLTSLRYVWYDRERLANRRCISVSTAVQNRIVPEALTNATTICAMIRRHHQQMLVAKLRLLYLTYDEASVSKLRQLYLVVAQHLERDIVEDLPAVLKEQLEVHV